MVLLKAFLFLVANLFIGFLLVFLIKAFLFYPSKELYFFGKKVPFTPALLYRKKDWLINKITSMLKDYLRDCDKTDEQTKISEWEMLAYEKAWEKFSGIESIKIMPAFLRNKIRQMMSVIIYEIVKQFFRSFVPYLIARYNIENYIDLLSKKLDVDTLFIFFNKYIFKYMFMISLASFFLIGIYNAVFYLIVH
ncbi:MAG: hypothetical protein B6D62_01475 [Candidatus Cloacimonas sp. 4484_275]|nr:MAG: hypothetical protein B6D62_01475 [Candidatus Cloacimonas sp. 4484_275]